MPSSNQFKPSEFKINQEVSSTGKMKIADLDVGTQPIIKSYEMDSIKNVRSKQGILATPDLKRNIRSQKDSRFSLNPLLREPLSIEEEEERAIEEKVNLRIVALVEESRGIAIQEGHKEGYKKGFEEAFNKVKEENATNIQKFNELVAQAEDAKMEIFRANERFLIELIFRIARMVLLKELTADKEYLLRLAKEVITRVGVRDHIKLKIHPLDAQTIEALQEGLEKSFGKMSNLNIEASAEVGRGGFRLETEWNAIDATIERQLAEVYESLIRQKAGENS